MAIEVFNRYEYKYKVDKETARQLMSVLNRNLILDDYCLNHGFYQISNIYIDNKNCDLIRHSTSKPEYKHKFRIRFYQQTVLENQMVYFEIKKKYKGLVNKRRCKMSYKQCKQLLDDNNVDFTEDYINEQILSEIKYLLNKDNYSENVQIMYKRIAYFDKCKDLRVSFDFDINSSDYKLLDDDYYLMEIKTHLSMPIWLIQELDKHNIRKQSYSKYGIHYYKQLNNKETNESINN